MAPNHASRRVLVRANALGLVSARLTRGARSGLAQEATPSADMAALSPVVAQAIAADAFIHGAAI